MHRNYTYVLSSGTITGKILAKSFNTKEEAIVLLGLPYVDYIKNPDAQIVDKLYEKYPQVKEKENILYVPTFRKNHCVDVSWISEKIDFEKYNVIVKLHPVDKKGVQGKVDSRIILDEQFMTYEWLWISQKIVTDYSGIGMESALLDKKIYFYLYDKDQYEAETGLNVDLYKEPISRYVTDSADKLIELLEEEYDFELLKQYRDKYIEIDTDDCSGQFASWLLNKLY